MSEAPLGNSPEARTATGEIKPVTTIEEAPKETPAPAETPTPPTPTATTKTETNEPPKEKTLLNEAVKPAVLTGAPEKYAAFTAPEGYEFNDTQMSKANDIFKKLNLSQAGGQELMNLFADEIKSVIEAPQKTWEDLRSKWIDEVRADPEIGGKLDQVKATVARAIDGLGDPKLANDFRQAMDFTGAGNNPAFIRAFYKLAQKVTEGGVVTGGTPVDVRAPNAPPATAAHRLYPNLK
jgi:hypothetical protein